MAVKYHTVTFLPENKSIRVENLKTIFETIGEENPEDIQLFFSCGAEGICQKCKVRSFQPMGPLTATEKGCLSDEELARGVRLACQARVVQDSQVEIQYKRPFTIALVNEDISSQGPARLQKIVFGSADARQPDIDLLLKAALEAGLDVSRFGLIEKLNDCLKNSSVQEYAQWTAVFFDGRLTVLEPGDTSAALYAAAVDLGTNTLQVSLVDVLHGKKIAVVTDSNPQIELGDTYESRLAMVEEDELNLEILNEEIVLRIDVLVHELCAACSVASDQVYEITVAGATGMLHLFLMRAPGPLEQHAEDAHCSGRFLAGQLDLHSTAQAGITVLPVISSYAGADITAAILATRLHRSNETTLLLDLGGSTKAVLYHEGDLFACAVDCTAVFDGSGLSCGMRPEAGAVAGVRLGDDGDLDIAVIDESLARGVCGSGMLELAACLRKTGLLDDLGNFVEPKGGSGPLQKRLTIVDDEPAIILFNDTGEFSTDIFVTRRDIEKLFETQGRVAAMLEYLCAQVGIESRKISRMFVSGALGGRLSEGTLASLGFASDVLDGRIDFIGNASKHGAQLALFDKALADEAEKLVRSVISIPFPWLPERHTE